MPTACWKTRRKPRRAFPPPVLPLAARERYLQLPPLDPRIAELARSFAAGAANDLARARAIERHLRTDYGYTLELPDREVGRSAGLFPVHAQEGPLRVLSPASMAVMLRTLGIPARLATGFQSGVYNPVSDFWLIRACDAHSWVEAWIPGPAGPLRPHSARPERRAGWAC